MDARYTIYQPSHERIAEAKDAFDRLKPYEADESDAVAVTVTFENGETAELPASLVGLMRDALECFRHGHGFSFAPDNFKMKLD